MSIKKTPIKKTIARYHYDLGDGAKVSHIPKYVTDGDGLFDELKTQIYWKHFKYEIHGKEVNSPRLMHIINFEKSHEPNAMDDYDVPKLLNLKMRLEKMTGVKFRYAVLNYYRDGNDHISYHSDREVNDGDIVVSVSVGFGRRFALKHKFRENVRHVFILENGDAMILNDCAIKKVYKHCVPKMKNAGPRINMTFRQ